MRRMTLGLSAAPALVGLVTLLPTYSAGQQTLQQAIEPIQESAEAGELEPAALEALKAMGSYLAGLQAFELSTEFEAELVMDNGQKVGLGGTTDYHVRRPDGLKVELVGDLGSREFIYDGKTLAVVSPADKVYGTADVAPTIKEMLGQVAEHLSIELPLADLFDYGTDDDLSAAVKEGFLVGPATLDGKSTKHYAYRTDGKDFEVWIQDGDAPLPLKIVIDDDTQPARPRFESNLTWTTDAAASAADFTFTPPEGYEQIDFVASTTAQEPTP